MITLLILSCSFPDYGWPHYECKGYRENFYKTVKECEEVKAKKFTTNEEYNEVKKKVVVTKIYDNAYCMYMTDRPSEIIITYYVVEDKKK